MRGRADPRPALPLSKPHYVAGADIGGTNLRLALADAQGVIAARWSASTTGIHNAESVVELIRGGVQSMLEEISAPVESLKAIAAGAPGATNVGDGIVVATSYLMGWRNVPFRALLEDALHVPAAGRGAHHARAGRRSIAGQLACLIGTVRDSGGAAPSQCSP